MTDNLNEGLVRAADVVVRKSHAVTALRLQAGLGENVLPGVEAIGAGYNPFLEYASADSITVQIFDWSKAGQKPVSFNPKYVVPSVVDVQQSDSATYTNVSGRSINTFQSSLSNLVSVGGGYNFFSGSLSVEYTSQSLTKAENEFTRIQQSISLWSLRLGVTPELRNYLSDSFRTYLDALPLTETAARELFERYGSHFLTGIVMGGRAVMSSATNKLTVDHNYSVDVVAKASYEGLTGQLSVEDRTKYQQSMNSFNYSSETSHFVVGGDGVLAASAFSGKQGFDAWKGSVGQQPDFVNFVSTIPLAEIWRLCKTDAQRNFLADFYARVWAPEQSRLRQRYANYLDSLVVITGGSSTIEPPAGYTKIPYDLNAGAGGDYIYLCFHAEPFRAVGTNKDCIAEVRIIYDNDPVPAGFIKLPQDLNKGAGGAYVYLCYRTVPYDNKVALKGITVIGGDNADIPPPYGFRKVPGDLNAGAGGEFVFVCTSLGD